MKPPNHWVADSITNPVHDTVNQKREYDTTSPFCLGGESLALPPGGGVSVEAADRGDVHRDSRDGHDQSDMEETPWRRSICRLLALFAGPARPTDLVQEGRRRNVEVHAFDTRRCEQHDLLDQMFWDSIVKNIRGLRFHGGMAAPPCSTFALSRSIDGVDGASPKPLRGEHPPDILGYQGLSVEEQARVKEGTACAMRALRMAIEFDKIGAPWLIESCDMRSGHPHVFKLPAFDRFIRETKPDLRRMFQCQFSSVSAKPSMFFVKRTRPF